MQDSATSFITVLIMCLSFLTPCKTSGNIFLLSIDLFPQIGEQSEINCLASMHASHLFWECLMGQLPKEKTNHLHAVSASCFSFGMTYRKGTIASEEDPSRGVICVKTKYLILTLLGQNLAYQIWAWNVIWCPTESKGWVSPLPANKQRGRLELLDRNYPWRVTSINAVRQDRFFKQA